MIPTRSKCPCSRHSSKFLTAGQSAGGSTVIKTSLPPPTLTLPSLFPSPLSLSLFRDRFYSLSFPPAFRRSSSATVLRISSPPSSIAETSALDLRRSSWIYELAAGITRIAPLELGFSTLVLLCFAKIDMQTPRRRRQVSESVCRREELQRNPWLVFGGGLVV